jgi:hypothetical protein
MLEFIGPLLPGRSSPCFVGPLLLVGALVQSAPAFVGPVLPVAVAGRAYLDNVPGVDRVVRVANLDMPDRGEAGYGESLPDLPVGLSSCYISPKLRAVVRSLDPVREKVGVARVRLAHGGSTVRCVTTGAAPARELTDVRRSAILEFSVRSRRRMMDLTASINRARAGLPKFMTLTYPGSWSPDPQRWKDDLDALGKRIVRRWPGASAIWRLEFQKRGAPHFHCLLFGVKYMDRAWLARAWAMIVTDLSLLAQRAVVNTLALLPYMAVALGLVRWAALLALLSPAQLMYIKHRAAGTQVVRVKSWNGVAAYTSKGMAHELGKLDQALAESGGVGRWWGVINREKLPLDVEVVVISLDVFWQLRRILRKLGGRPGVGRWQGMAAFVDPRTIAVLVRWIGARI